MEGFIRRRDEIFSRKFLLPCKDGLYCDVYSFSNISHYQCHLEFLNYRYQIYVDLSKLVDEYLLTILLPLLWETEDGKYCDHKTGDGQCSRGLCELIDNTLSGEDDEHWTPCQQYNEKKEELYKKSNEELYNLLYFFTHKTPERCDKKTFGCGSCRDEYWNNIFLYIYENHVEQKVNRIYCDTDSNDGCLYFKVDWFKSQST